MTTFNLRQPRLRSGEQFRELVEVEIEPLVLGGQEYRPEPALVPADLTVTKASSGTVFELSFRARLEGPCFRCLADASLELPDKILHAEDCAGLCPVCGKDLNVEPHTHEEHHSDPRWAALDDLRL